MSIEKQTKRRVYSFFFYVHDTVLLGLSLAFFQLFIQLRVYSFLFFLFIKTKKEKQTKDCSLKYQTAAVAKRLCAAKAQLKVFMAGS